MQKVITLKKSSLKKCRINNLITPFKKILLASLGHLLNTTAVGLTSGLTEPM